MAAYNLYIDTDARKAVVGPASSDIAQLPPFVQEDSLLLRIWLLNNRTQFDGYSKIPVSGITLEVAIGTKIGNATTYFAQQFTWTPSTDLGQPYFEGLLQLNTAGINNLLGGEASKTAFFQVRRLESALPQTVLFEQITVHAATIKSGATITPALPTPLSAEAANAAYLGRVITGYFDLMFDSTTGIRIYCDANGALKTDPIS